MKVKELAEKIETYEGRVADLETLNSLKQIILSGEKRSESSFNVTTSGGVGTGLCYSGGGFISYSSNTDSIIKAAASVVDSNGYGLSKELLAVIDRFIKNLNAEISAMEVN